MADNELELRSIAWSQALPFVRLFRSLRLALNPSRLLLALACVMGLYAGGRVLDWIWGRSGGVVTLAQEPRAMTEIQVYAERPYDEFVRWVREARQAVDQSGFVALQQANLAGSVEEARQKLASASLRSLLLDFAFQKEVDDLWKAVAEQLKVGLAAIDKDAQASSAVRRDKRAALAEAADTVRCMLSGKLSRTAAAANVGTRAIETIAAADPTVTPQKRADLQARLTAASARRAQLRLYEESQPRGPFISLLLHEQHCFAAAVRGVLTGEWGFAGGAFDAEPSLAGSLVSAVKGLCWLWSQRPWYTVFFGVFSLLLLALFGGAICRSAAVHATRDEAISMRAALAFVGERYGGFLLAPLMPFALLFVIALVMAICGWLGGAIPYLGDIFTGLFYGLALFGGFVAAAVLLATAFGFHLMWPTIAAEGSDGFDALSRAFSYVGSRIWHVLFYSFVLLAYGAASFILVRLVLVLMLKLAHDFTGFGMNALSSARLDAVGNLDAIWSMPAWSELALLPRPGSAPIWGTFFTAPLGGAEPVAAVLIVIWVFLASSLLGAFVLSYFFCGSTQMYFLLRRDVDATDWDEIYYEEPAETLPPAAPMSESPAAAAAPETAAPTAGAAEPPTTT